MRSGSRSSSAARFNRLGAQKRNRSFDLSNQWVASVWSATNGFSTTTLIDEVLEGDRAAQPSTDASAGWHYATIERFERETALRRSRAARPRVFAADLLP